MEAPPGRPYHRAASAPGDLDAHSEGDEMMSPRPSGESGAHRLPRQLASGHARGHSVEPVLAPRESEDPGRASSVHPDVDLSAIHLVISSEPDGRPSRGGARAAGGQAAHQGGRSWGGGEGEALVSARSSQHPFGNIDSLTPLQERELAEIRRRTQERTGGHPRFHDIMLLRFLRARKFDVEAAWAMLSDHLDWRSSTGIDDLPEGMSSVGPAAQLFPEMPAIKRCYPHGFHGLDRLGRPVYIERLGQLDLQTLLASASAERVAQYFAHELERLTTHRLLACSLAQGRLVEKTLTVLDLSGLSMRTISQAAARKMLQAITKVQQNQYPEIMGEMIIVNAPRAFHLAWKFACPMIDANTVSKIRGLQEDPTSRLLELIEPQMLPRFLGGQCDCSGFPGGCMASDQGPWQDPAIAAELASAPHWEHWNRLALRARYGSQSPSQAAAEALAPKTARTTSYRWRQHSGELGVGSVASTDFFDALGDEASVALSPCTAQYRLQGTPACSSTDRGLPEDAHRNTRNDMDGRVSTLTRPATSQDQGPVWHNIRRMEDVYVGILEEWLARAPQLEGNGNIRQIQEVQRYFDSVAIVQRSQATVHTIAAEFYKLMAQHARIRAELAEAERRLQCLRPQDGTTPSPDFVQQAMRVTELTGALFAAQAQRDELHGQFRTCVADFRHARASAASVDGSVTSRRRLGVSCCGRWGAARDPAAELREAVADLEAQQWRFSMSEATTRSPSTFASPASASVTFPVAEAVFLPEEVEVASQAPPSEAGESYYTCDGEASHATCRSPH